MVFLLAILAMNKNVSRRTPGCAKQKASINKQNIQVEEEAGDKKQTRFHNLHLLNLPGT